VNLGGKTRNFVTVLSFFCGRVLWLNDTYPTAKVSKGTSSNMDAKSTLEQLLAPYTDPESHNAQRHRQTDGQTDGRTEGQQAYANSRSYCVAVRSAKKL